MKTVMKKLFSLMLVAVLMVGVMPFQAFADEITLDFSLSLTAGTNYSVDEIVAQNYDGSSTNYWVHRTAPSAEDYIRGASFDAVEGGTYTLYVVETVTTPPAPATVTCNTCGETYNEGTTHTCPTLTCETCGDPYTKGTTHTCPTCTVVSGCVLTKNHAGEHQCACGLYPQKGSAHNAGCPFDETTANTYSLKVLANLYVGETLHDTITLDIIPNLSGSARVYDVISQNKDRLYSKFPAGYNNIEWTEAVYYMIDATTSGVVDTRMTLESEDHVYINLYSSEKLVVVRVHTAKSYSIDRSVQVGGFRVGETVTYDDVLKAVKKFYNVSSMKMYTYSEWEKVVAGKDASTTPFFEVHGGDNVYEVYVTGSHKTSSSGSNYTADSSNPKTGDTIFAPVAVMGLSVSALAVLFFLNKKRAY